eukprot:11187688-Lingulodinium_polyedra.AAC.1
MSNSACSVWAQRPFCASVLFVAAKHPFPPAMCDPNSEHLKAIGRRAWLFRRGEARICSKCAPRVQNARVRD